MAHLIIVYFNFDVGNIEYNPSHKDMHAAEMHHILSDSMFKPIKRVSLSNKFIIGKLNQMLMFYFIINSIENIAKPIYRQKRLKIIHLLDTKRALK